MRGGKKIIALVLALVIGLSLFGCEKRAEADNKKDIIYTTDGPPSADLGERAEEVFFCLLKYYVTKSGVSNIPEKTIDKLRDMSHEIRVRIEETTISDHSYSRMLDLLETRGYSVVDERFDGGEASITRELYLELCSLLGEGYIGSVLYDILLYYYDYTYQDYMEKYEKYGYAYLLEDAKVSEYCLVALTDHIGRESFVSVLSSGLAIIELATYGIDEHSYNSFSDEEILLFVKSIDLTFEIGSDGWEYILGYMIPSVMSNDSDILSKMLENGDIKTLSVAMPRFVMLLRKMQSGLSAADIALVRSGDKEAIIGSLFLSLDEEGWQMFFDLTEISLDFDSFEAIYEDKYGEEYISYAEGLVPISNDQLRASVGKIEFYESLEGYLGGISPMLSYGMNR